MAAADATTSISADDVNASNELFGEFLKERGFADQEWSKISDIGVRAWLSADKGHIEEELLSCEVRPVYRSLFTKCLREFSNATINEQEDSNLLTKIFNVLHLGGSPTKLQELINRLDSLSGAELETIQENFRYENPWNYKSGDAFLDRSLPSLPGLKKWAGEYYGTVKCFLFSMLADEIYAQIGAPAWYKGTIENRLAHIYMRRRHKNLLIDILAFEWRYGKYLHDQFYSLLDVNDVRNTMFLYSPVETAFDDEKLSFLYLPLESVLKCRVFEVSDEWLMQHCNNKKMYWPNKEKCRPSLRLLAMHFQGCVKKYKSTLSEEEKEFVQTQIQLSLDLSEKASNAYCEPCDKEIGSYQLKDHQNERHHFQNVTSFLDGIETARSESISIKSVIGDVKLESRDIERFQNRTQPQTTIPGTISFKNNNFKTSNMEIAKFGYYDKRGPTPKSNKFEHLHEYNLLSLIDTRWNWKINQMKHQARQKAHRKVKDLDKKLNKRIKRWKRKNTIVKAVKKLRKNENLKVCGNPVYREYFNPKKFDKRNFKYSFEKKSTKAARKASKGPSKTLNATSFATDTVNVEKKERNRKGQNLKRKQKNKKQKHKFKKGYFVKKKGYQGSSKGKCRYRP